MADLVNPYANPYLPSFVNQRPRINDFKPVVPTVTMPSYSQIQSVNGYSGAREYALNNLAPGSSAIIAESDPNTARVYIVAKDQTGQPIVEGYSLIHEEEPKPVTMDDLSAKMSELLDRMNKLEEKNNGEPNTTAAWTINSTSPGDANRKSNGARDAQSSANDAK